MRSLVSFALLVFGLSVDAQKSGGKPDPNKPYKAGDKAPDVDPLMQFDKTPAWPSNFGGANMPHGPAPGGCAPFELVIGKKSLQSYKSVSN
jgi:hypothetical protein